MKSYRSEIGSLFFLPSPLCFHRHDFSPAEIRKVNCLKYQNKGGTTGEVVSPLEPQCKRGNQTG